MLVIIGSDLDWSRSLSATTVDSSNCSRTYVSPSLERTIGVLAVYLIIQRFNREDWAACLIYHINGDVILFLHQRRCHSLPKHTNLESDSIKWGFEGYRPSHPNHLLAMELQSMDSSLSTKTSIVVKTARKWLYIVYLKSIYQGLYVCSMFEFNRAYELPAYLLGVSSSVQIHIITLT